MAVGLRVVGSRLSPLVGPGEWMEPEYIDGYVQCQQTSRIAQLVRGFLHGIGVWDRRRR